MQPYQQEFIALALSQQVLRFGEFRLKSGRLSPYFFNAGLFNTGGAMATLGRCYARAIGDAAPPFDMLFGPAYKGIPLVTATAMALADGGDSRPFAFNRKEAKQHGEGGSTIGAPLAGRVLVIDDVISAGTAIRESIDMIRAAGATPAGVVVALDRQERGKDSSLSAVQEVQQAFSIPVVHIISLADLIEHLEAEGRQADLAALRGYRAQWGVEDNP